MENNMPSCLMYPLVAMLWALFALMCVFAFSIVKDMFCNRW